MGKGGEEGVCDSTFFPTVGFVVALFVTGAAGDAGLAGKVVSSLDI